MERHTAERSLWKGWARLAAALLIAALSVTACGEDPKTELSGHFGPGSGGPPLSINPLDYVTIDITKSSGTAVGFATYDSSVLLAFGPISGGDFENLADDPVAPTIAVTLSRITGRPDTPCRFQAGILARDGNFEILKSGGRKNGHELDFYQVNLKKDALRLSLFCVSLRDEVGAAIQVITGDAALIDSLQVHYILNSIRKS